MSRVADFIEIVPDLLSELSRRVVNTLNWRIVRGLGELQILTKASYVALIVVPMLAATWPAVRIVVNQHNKAVHEATVVINKIRGNFDQATDKLSTALASEDINQKNVNESNNTRGELIKEKANEFIGVVDDYLSDYSERALETPRLPWTLAAAFFAALSVVIGHLLYQIFAPDQVKSMTWDQFILSKKDDFSKHPSGEGLRNARLFEKSRIGQRVASSERFEDEQLMRDLYGVNEEREEDLEARVQELEIRRARSLLSWIDSGESPAPRGFQEKLRVIIEERLGIISANDERLSENMSVIERGARAEYLHHASQKPLAIFITTALYLFGLAIIISIIKVQTISVADAAQIDGILSLFGPK